MQPSQIAFSTGRLISWSCPPKAKATRSNRVGRAIYTRARYRDLQAAFPRCRVATLICESEESTRRWTSTLKPTSIGCGLPQIPAGTSNKIRSPTLRVQTDSRRASDIALASHQRSACEHSNLNAGAVLRSNSRNNPGGRFIGVYGYIAVVAKCLWHEAESRL